MQIVGSYIPVFKLHPLDSTYAVPHWRIDLNRRTDVEPPGPWYSHHSVNV
jgi:hypothetical protein